MREVIVDTSALQYLHQVGLLDLLRRLYGEITVPAAVAQEVSIGKVQGVDLPEIDGYSWMGVRSLPSGAARIAPGEADPDLGAGEREVLALATTRADVLVVLDDAAARRHARQMGLTVTGILGVLLRAKREGLIPEVGPIVERLGELGFYLDPKTRVGVLRLAGEIAPDDG